MKKLVFTLLVVINFGCQDNHLNRPTPFDKSVGERIPSTDAERWIDRFSKSQPAARIQMGFISSDQLDKMLDTKNLIGIAFQHGLDESGIHHVMAIPIDDDGSLWAGKKYIVDAASNTQIDQSVGKKWAVNYMAKHPGEVLYHKFGSDIFGEIKSISYFTKFEIQPAINDNDEPQLLLVVKNELENGRTLDDGTVFFDKSQGGPDNP